MKQYQNTEDVSKQYRCAVDELGTTDFVKLAKKKFRRGLLDNGIQAAVLHGEIDTKPLSEYIKHSNRKDNGRFNDVPKAG